MSRFAFLLAYNHEDAVETVGEDLKGTMIGFSRAALPDKTDLRVITRFSEFISDGATTPIFLSRKVTAVILDQLDGMNETDVAAARKLYSQISGEVAAGRACWANPEGGA